VDVGRLVSHGRRHRLVAPNFEGGKKYLLGAVPIVSLGKAGNEVRFSSRNDNISLALIDDGNVRAGGRRKIPVHARQRRDELKGLKPVRWGGEAGASSSLSARLDARARPKSGTAYARITALPAISRPTRSTT